METNRIGYIAKINEKQKSDAEGLTVAFHEEEHYIG